MTVRGTAFEKATAGDKEAETVSISDLKPSDEASEKSSWLSADVVGDNILANLVGNGLFV